MMPSVEESPAVGRIVDGEHRLPLRVYYEDTDAAGIVYYANYLRFFERGRTEMLACIGIDHAALLPQGLVYVVAEVALRYRTPGRLGDVLTVATRLERIRKAGLAVHQRVMRDGHVLVEGQVAVAFVGPDGRPRRQPDDWIKAFEAIVEGALPRA